MGIIAISGRSAGLADRVVILANADDVDSLRIAKHYADKRGVPVANIIALPMPMTETITWREFVLSIWQPLQDELVKQEWIDATPMKLFDDVGRRKIASSGHNMSYLVVCRGVPLKINHDQALFQEVKGLENRQEFKTNRGAVDAELSMMAYGQYNINAFVPNPLFRNEKPSRLLSETIVKVSRLDGPTADDVISLINSTLDAETNGLIGRAYVDVKGPHQQGIRWMELAAEQLKIMNYDPEVHDDPETFPVGVRMDAPAIYLGWYAPDLNGPFALPGFRFAPGAIAIHIHSYSAGTLRSDSKGWCGPLIARGAVATTGAVFEPYLQLMHFPNMILDALAGGLNLGDAAYFSLPVLSWQNVVISDPLYQPFKRSLNEQWLQRDHLPSRLAPYVTLREMQRLLRAGFTKDAADIARQESKERPSLAVGVALGELLLAGNDKTGAADAIGFAPHLKSVPSNDWSLLRTAGDMLAVCEKPKEALAVYANLLAIKEVPRTLQIEWYRPGIKMANAAGDMSLAIAWEHELTKLLTEVKNKAGRSPPDEASN
uniref:TIGR03790 family protein n=3 Tax=Cephaloticoccus sp. TaxID=1985742 RepID=UPI00404B66B7